MISFASFATILVMAATTYSTRIGGYLLLRNRRIDGRARRAMEAAPGCVLLAVISPAFVTSRPADLAALAITVVAASRLPMLATVAIAVAATGLLRQIMG
ncbi:AzlD family protein [Aureimonas leprariae]|uniref:AzlD family protein n=1 Tax=Plantimonas leprariae TaxID=2615207 RepID=A0A7V7PLS8_9HYPH|nr:AzlD family protein [Aureimonas leprariae]KAB0677339.1 AzlD family protein [Aureimonas leprariae]